METFRIRCPECQSMLRVQVKYAGSQRRCPQPECGQLIQIPLLPAGAEQRKTPVSEVKEKSEVRRAISKTQEVASKPIRKSKPVQAAVPASRKRPLQGRKAVAAKSTRAHKRPWRWLLVGVALFAVGGAVFYSLPSGNTGGVTPQTTSLQAESTDTFRHQVEPFLKKYCIDCHGADLQEGGVRFDNLADPPDFLAKHGYWTKVYQQISVGSMPPQDVDMPEPDERLAVAKWLDQAVNHFDCGSVNNPGRVTVHRLNRNEYDNTIRDLLGVDLHLSKTFPSDDVGYGFDNIGDVLTMSPLLMERYLDASEKAVASVIVLPEALKINKEWSPEEYVLTGAAKPQRDEVGMISRGTATAKFQTRVAGEYRFRLQVSATQAGEEDAEFDLKLNNEAVQVHQVPGHREVKTIEWTAKLPAGQQSLLIDYKKDRYDPEAEDPKRKDRNMYIAGLKIQGPLKLTQADFPAAHRRIVTHVPQKDVPAAEAARKVLEPLASRAYRRPATKDELDRLLKIFEIAQQRQEGYERSLQIAVQGILVSPQFLFRIEEKPDSAAAQEIQTLGDYELASRLSYFLWSSMPDDELFQLAAAGKLHEPAVLEQQTRRMLKDPKAEALTVNFVGQWLGLRKLVETRPDAELFPEYTDELVQFLPRETELLFAEVLREDRNLLELLTADYTYINEPLANLYGIPDVKGKEFRRVSLKGVPRKGLISHAGILTLTSFPNRTSPVKRGEWVLDNILAQAPPPPPASVPGLEETQKANPNLSFREQLVLHLSDPVCKSCHVLMDGIGFGLENFDAIGRWREQDGAFAIDSRGDLPGGVSFNGPIELIGILSKKPDDFTRCVTEKMLTYALGRGLEWYDKCTVDDIIAVVRADDYKMSRLIVEIVLSPPFRNQSVEGLTH